MSTTAEAPMIAPPEAMATPHGAPSPTPAPTTSIAPPSSVVPLIDRDALKGLMKEAVLEVLHEQREWIGTLFIEAWEDGNLAAAIDEGRETELVPVEEVYAILEAMRCES